MKKILTSFLFAIIPTISYANCSIQVETFGSLRDSISKKGYIMNPQAYDSLCNKLKNNKAGIAITPITLISDTQTTVGVFYSLYALDLKLSVKTFATSGKIMSTRERSTTAENELLYKTTMLSLEDLTAQKEQLDIMFTQLTQLRTAVK